MGRLVGEEATQVVQGALAGWTGAVGGKEEEVAQPVVAKLAVHMEEQGCPQRGASRLHHAAGWTRLGRNPTA